MSALDWLHHLLEKSNLHGVKHAAKFNLAYEFIFLILYIDLYGWKL